MALDPPRSVVSPCKELPNLVQPTPCIHHWWLGHLAVLEDVKMISYKYKAWARGTCECFVTWEKSGGRAQYFPGRISKKSFYNKAGVQRKAVKSSSTGEFMVH